MHVFFFQNSFLATADSYNGLKARFHLGLTTVHRAIKETCDAIWEVLKDDMLTTADRGQMDGN